MPEVNRITGTTPPIYVPDSPQPRVIEVGKHYFWLQIVAAQVFFSDDTFFRRYFGVGLDRVNNVVLTSNVRLDVPTLDGAARGIKQVRELRPNQPVQLGLRSNLIKLVPATMTQVEVSLDLLVDLENQLAKLAELINTDSLFAPLALSPSALAVAKTISELAQKTIQALIPASQQQPVLQFGGAFNLVGGEAREGYYAILGTRDADAPLPPPNAKLEVKENGALLIDGRPADRLSYVVLKLGIAEARTRDAAAHTTWHKKLREAETEAQQAGQDPLVDAERRRQIWEKVLGLLREARVLLAADPEYLPDEADKIYWASYMLCKQVLFEANRMGRAASEDAARGFDEARSRAVLGIPADSDLDRALDDYLAQVNRTRAHVPKDVL